MKSDLYRSSKARAMPGEDAHTRAARPVLFALQLLATVHIVMFYITRVPSYLSLGAYEQGRERMPFQGRMLMVYPLRWAHQSATLTKAAAWLTSTRMWVPRTVLPEDIVEFVLDVVAVAFAGFVARELYRSRSEKGRLIHYVYPLFLVMVAASYCVLSMNFIRYVYDLPSLGLFAAGLYFIYLKDQPAWFALVFLCATINRETSIFLLLFFAHHRCCRNAQRFQWKRLGTLPVGGVAAALALVWVGFHLWLARHFGTAAAEVKPGLSTNVLLLLWPFAWPQLAAAGAYMLPLLALQWWRQRQRSVLAWCWVLPAWTAVMFVYGSMVEIRLFGELLPLIAASAVLLCEDHLFAADAQPA